MNMTTLPTPKENLENVTINSNEVENRTKEETSMNGSTTEHDFENVPEENTQVTIEKPNKQIDEKIEQSSQPSESSHFRIGHYFSKNLQKFEKWKR